MPALHHNSDLIVISSDQNDHSATYRWSVNALSTHHFLFTICHPNTHFSLIPWYSSSWQLNVLCLHQIQTMPAASSLIGRERLALKTGWRKIELLTETRIIYPQSLILPWKFSQWYLIVYGKCGTQWQQANQWIRNSTHCILSSHSDALRGQSACENYRTSTYLYGSISAHHITSECRQREDKE